MRVDPKRIVHVSLFPSGAGHAATGVEPAVHLAFGDSSSVHARSPSFSVTQRATELLTPKGTRLGERGGSDEGLDVSLVSFERRCIHQYVPTTAIAPKKRRARKSTATIATITSVDMLRPAGRCALAVGYAGGA